MIIKYHKIVPPRTYLVRINQYNIHAQILTLGKISDQTFSLIEREKIQTDKINYNYRQTKSNLAAKS